MDLLRPDCRTSRLELNFLLEHVGGMCITPSIFLLWPLTFFITFDYSSYLKYFLNMYIISYVWTLFSNKNKS
jgi:hypothetical protein